MADDTRELLAAEYSLGVLRGEECAEVQRLLARDPDFRALVDGWQIRLAPLAEALPPQALPPGLLERTFAAIARTVALPAPVPLELERVRRRLARWRGLSIAALAAAASFAMLWAGGVPKPWGTPEPMRYVALLSGEGGQGFLVTVNMTSRMLSIRNLGMKPPPEEMYELWLVKERPMPLGQLTERSYSLRHIESGVSLSEFTSGTTLAISMEKASEPVQDGPKGPIVFKGSLILQTPDRKDL